MQIVRKGNLVHKI